MSKFTSLIGLALGALTGVYFLFASLSAPTVQDRSPASISPIAFHSPKAHLHQSKKDPLFKHTEKLEIPIQIDVSQSSANEIQTGESFELIAYVVSGVDLENVEVVWNLPRDVELVSGATTTNIGHLKANEVTEIPLILISHIDNNQQINVRASASMGATRISNAGQFNTTRQAQIEKEKLALLKRNRDYIKMSLNKEN